jgi:hypothetical protein
MLVMGMPCLLACLTALGSIAVLQQSNNAGASGGSGTGVGAMWIMFSICMVLNSTLLAVVQVEELRSQIRLLQAVGYNSLGEDDGGEDGPAGGAADGSGAGAANGGRLVNSLEAMLLQKNRSASSPATCISSHSVTLTCL